MDILLLAARPREIEEEISCDKEFKIVKEKFLKGIYGNWYWEIFMADEYGIMKIINAKISPVGVVDDITVVHFVTRDIEEAVAEAKKLCEAKISA
jgi:hypothetical protein